MTIIRIIVLLAITGPISLFSADDIALQKRFGRVIAMTGKAVATRGDGSSSEIKVGDELPAGTILKTEAEGTVDLFFRRIGTIVQVQTNTTLSLDKLEMEMKSGKLVKRTELSLKDGSILACVRVLIPESKVLIRTPKVLFHVPGTGLGRFEFWAEGAALVGRKSKLTVVADVSGDSTAVSPGQYFSTKSTNAVQANPSFFESFSKRMDALQATAATLTPPPLAEDLP